MRRWLKWALGILFTVSVLPILILFVAFVTTSCFKLSCFDDFGSRCKYVDISVDTDFGEVRYEINKNYATDTCYFTKTIVTLTEDTELKGLLENKSLQCKYFEGEYNPAWVASWYGGVDSCTGDLRGILGDLVLFV